MLACINDPTFQQTLRRFEREHCREFEDQEEAQTITDLSRCCSNAETLGFSFNSVIFELLFDPLAPLALRKRGE